MNIQNLLQMIMLTGWIKEKLLQLWVDPQELVWVNFSDMNSLNQLAQKIMPNLLKNNPGVANQIKQTAWQFVPEKWAEIIEMIGG